MEIKLKNGRDFYVDGERAVKIADANPNRRVLNLYTGADDLYFGGNNKVIAGGIAGYVPASPKPVEVKLQGEIWVIRAKGTAGKCGVMEEING